MTTMLMEKQTGGDREQDMACAGHMSEVLIGSRLYSSHTCSQVYKLL